MADGEASDDDSSDETKVSERNKEKHRVGDGIGSTMEHSGWPEINKDDEEKEMTGAKEEDRRWQSNDRKRGKKKGKGRGHPRTYDDAHKKQRGSPNM